MSLIYQVAEPIKIDAQKCVRQNWSLDLRSINQETFVWLRLLLIRDTVKTSLGHRLYGRHTASIKHTQNDEIA